MVHLQHFRGRVMAWMSPEEFKAWRRGKRLYRFGKTWIERWEGKDVLRGCFALPKEVELKPRPEDPKLLTSETADGKWLNDHPWWKVGYNRTARKYVATAQNRDAELELEKFAQRERKKAVNAAVCGLCGKRCSKDDFCRDCGAYICSECNEICPIGKHFPDEHKRTPR